MSSSVVSLREARLEPLPEVVEALEELLERAKSGEIRGYAFVSCCDENAVATEFRIGEGSISEYVTGFERLKLRLLKVGGEDEL